MKRSATSTHVCCYPTCRANVHLKRLSNLLQYEVLQKLQFLILDNVRVCPNHEYVSSWDNVNEVGIMNKFTSSQIERALEILRNPKPKINQSVSFSNYYFLFEPDLGKKNNNITNNNHISRYSTSINGVV